jgi:predicted TIM-barrel fold metal-dependent hydrolase
LGVHEELKPFFKAADQLELPVYLHAVQHGHRIVNLPTYRMHGLEIFAPSEGELTVASLITSGLFDECPTLQVIVAEMGTAHIIPLVERMDAAFRASRLRYEDDEAANAQSRTIAASTSSPASAAQVARDKNALPPSHYFKNNVSWTIETEEPELPDAMRFIGPERFLFATDYPHDDPGGKMKFKDVELLEANAVLSKAEKEMLRSDNAIRLFQL